MNDIFTSTFLSDELASWRVEQHVPDGYPDFAVRDGALVLYDAGNRILPNMPASRNLTVGGCLDADWDVNQGVCSFHLYFGYDAARRKGPRLEIAADGEALSVRLVAGREVLATQSSEPFDAGPIDFALSVDGPDVLLSLNSEERFAYRLPESAEGVVALGRGVFTGELRLTRFAIRSTDPLPGETLWDDVSIPFAPLNGMDIPIVWTVNAAALGDDIYRVDVELSGGERTRPDVPWFPYHGFYVEYLDRPYLRIESGTSTHELTLSDDTLVLANPTRPLFYDFNRNPPWPLRRTFYLRGLRADARLVVGYRAYGNRKANRHQEVTRPHETVYDVATGQAIYAGPALTADAPALALHSPPDKAICRQIAPAVHDYEKALAFACRNHFFADDETCRFTFELTASPDAFAHDLKVRYRLENAFFEPVDEYRDAGLGGAVDALAPGIGRKRSAEVNLGRMAPGVYHLRYRLLRNNRVVEEDYRAFEVGGETESGLEASGLPVCFNFNTGLRGSDTDYFDPWKQDTVDVSHYIQVCTSIMPHLAREKRLWELLDVYGRDWFLWNAWRVMEHTDLEHSRDLIAHADYVFRRVYKSVFRPTARKYFKKPMLRILLDYARAHDFPVEPVQRCLDEGTTLDKATFDVLVDGHFYPFLDFLLDRYMAELRDVQEEVRAINPRARMSSYGPLPLYTAAYKTAHAVHTMGPYRQGDALAAVRDGFFLFEDYPYAARYGNQRGPFLLADIKRLSPRVTIYPELYAPMGIIKPNPDAALARAWPSYGLWSASEQASETILKRVLEYVYAAVWHDGQRFDYWRDYGFQTFSWSRELFADFLGTWGFIDKHPPRRPLKANACISNEACVRNHRIFYDEYPGTRYEACGDLFNTAEECIAYTYEMSRSAGQNAGFVADFSSLGKLSADDIDTLVLPPLTKVAQTDLDTIRRLHEQGVSLLGFEVVDGLEDLFGVNAAEPKHVTGIAVNTNVAANPLLPLADLTEYTEHRACVGTYESAGAQVLLQAEAPVLFAHETAWGKTALFSIPPTAVRRQDQPHRVNLGRDSVSRLINESTRMVLRHLSNPVVETDAGKIIAFEDTAGAVHIIVEEDAHPLPARTIHPILELNLPGLDPDKITGTREFAVLSSASDSVEISLTLEPDAFAILSVPGGRLQSIAVGSNR